MENKSTGSSVSKPKISLVQENSSDEKLGSDDVFSRLFRDCLTEAVESGASDIHVEPGKDLLQIRLRIHGCLSIWRRIEKRHGLAFVARIKSLVNLDLAIVDKPQDSRAEFSSLGIDLRVSSIPVLYGEKIVLRLLRHDQNFDIKASGFPLSTLKILKDVCQKRDGLILISGPTGSGKTTTLYSLIDSLDRKSRNVSTLENPVEFSLAGLSQIDIGDHGMSFSDGLRALMRQDPDVVLVGEIRDQETAELCFKAASTGHLVFSTVHANGAKEVVERLTGLGVDGVSIKSNLRFSAAQRLLRLLCRHCSQPGDQKALEFMSEIIGKQRVESNIRVRNSSGCKLCQNGIAGRLPILEYMNQSQVIESLDRLDEQTRVKNSIKDQVVDLLVRGQIDHWEAREYL